MMLCHTPRHDLAGGRNCFTVWRPKIDLVAEQQIILQRNPSKHQKMRNAHVGRHHERKPRQQMNNTDTPKSEEADPGETASPSWEQDGDLESSMNLLRLL